jgi:CyaY protein
VDRLDEAEYERRAQSELVALRDSLDDLDSESVEAELASGILTVEFLDGTRFVINSHRAARQIWMAARHRAWHFDWSPDTAAWRATKTGDELWAALAAAVSEQLGRPVQLSRIG